MTLQVLIPCLEQTLESIQSLCSFFHIDSDAVFCNQCGKDQIDSFSFHGHTVTVHSVSWKGVSKARNYLIANCSADIGVFIDDDCILSVGYSQAVLKAYEDCSGAVAIRFNTTREHWNPVHAEAHTFRRAKFKDLSSFGMWGFSFRTAAFQKLGVSFDEHLGAPNYLYNGEDSVFLFDVCKATKEIYAHPFFLCSVEETRESTWFGNYEERYYVTKGYVYTHLYKCLWLLALARMYVSYRKEYGSSWQNVFQAAKKGHRMYKTDHKK